MKKILISMLITLTILSQSYADIYSEIDTKKQSLTQISNGSKYVLAIDKLVYKVRNNTRTQKKLLKSISKARIQIQGRSGTKITQITRILDYLEVKIKFEQQSTVL